MVDGAISVERETYLYIAENKKLNKLYIGIGYSINRIFQPHNPDAQAIISDPDTVILQTSKPFSSREDAAQAEAAAIHIAAFLGASIVTDPEEILTNRSAVSGSKKLVPVVGRIDGTVKFADLSKTAIVTIKPDTLGDSRGAIHAGRTPVELSERSAKCWPLGKSAQMNRPVKRLIARLKTTGIILGDWDVDEYNPYIINNGDDEFNLINPSQHNPRGTVGKILDMEGNRLGNRVTWSADIK